MAAQITPLPTPVPSKTDPTNFDTRADAFLGALPTFATEANALSTEVNNESATAATAANNASASAVSAAASALSASNSATAATNAANASDTSTTSNTIGVGTKTFTVTAGKNWLPGVTLQMFNSIGNLMLGTITSYSSTTLVVESTSFQGSGTYTLWYLGIPVSALTNPAVPTFMQQNFGGM